MKKQQKSGSKLFIKNIPQELSKEEIRAFFEPLIAGPFKIEKGRNKGEKSMKHAFLIVESGQDYQQLINREFRIKSKCVTIRPYLSPEERNLVNKDISARRVYLASTKNGISNKEIKEVLGAFFGEVESCFSLRDQQKKLLQASVTFRKRESATKSLYSDSFIHQEHTYWIQKNKKISVSDSKSGKNIQTKKLKTNPTPKKLVRKAPTKQAKSNNNASVYKRGLDVYWTEKGNRGEGKNSRNLRNAQKSNFLSSTELLGPNHLPIDQKPFMRLHGKSFDSEKHFLTKMSDLKRDLDHIDHPDFLQFNRQKKRRGEPHQISIATKKRKGVEEFNSGTSRINNKKLSQFN